MYVFVYVYVCICMSVNMCTKRRNKSVQDNLSICHRNISNIFSNNGNKTNWRSVQMKTIIFIGRNNRIVAVNTLVKTNENAGEHTLSNIVKGSPLEISSYSYKPKVGISYYWRSLAGNGHNLLE